MLFQKGHCDSPRNAQLVQNLLRLCGLCGDLCPVLPTHPESLYLLLKLQKSVLCRDVGPSSSPWIHL